MQNTRLHPRVFSIGLNLWRNQETSALYNIEHANKLDPIYSGISYNWEFIRSGSSPRRYRDWRPNACSCGSFSKWYLIMKKAKTHNSYSEVSLPLFYLFIVRVYIDLRVFWERIRFLIVSHWVRAINCAHWNYCSTTVQFSTIQSWASRCRIGCDSVCTLKIYIYW